MGKLSPPFVPPGDKLINIKNAKSAEPLKTSIDRLIREGEIPVFKGKLTDNFEDEFQ